MGVRVDPEKRPDASSIMFLHVASDGGGGDAPCRMWCRMVQNDLMAWGRLLKDGDRAHIGPRRLRAALGYYAVARDARGSGVRRADNEGK